MATYPFINRLNFIMVGVSLDPVPVPVNSLYPYRINSFRCTNTTNNDISVTVVILKEINNIPNYCKISYQEFIPPYKSLDIFEGERGRMAYILPGDIVLANADSAIKTFDILGSYDEYTLSNQ